MRRLGLVWRVALTVLAALIALQLLVASGYYLERSRATQSGLRLPLPDQVAALVTLLDRAEPEQRALILRAANGVGVHADVLREVPPVPAGAQHLDGVERALQKYLGDASQRFISVRRVDDGSKAPGWRLRRYFDAHAQIVVALASGEFLCVEAGDELISRIFGLPAGFWAGIIGFAVAALAIVAVIRETRPLALLVRSVDRFGAALEPAPLPERGAREVRSLIRAVNRMQSHIAELMKTRTFIIGAISHDLRTYLTRLRLRVETLPEGETRTRAIKDVEDMQALIEDALTFARTTFAGVKRERIDLVALVEHECEVRASAGKAVTAELPRGAAMVDGSSPALARVTGNLVDNALRYGGAAQVSLANSGSAVELRVEDRGPGVPASERERIFEPFHRLDTSRNRERGGAGLGLAIARQIVEGHSGTITVEDRPGGGARFSVRLPLADGGPLPDASRGDGHRPPAERAPVKS